MIIIRERTKLATATEDCPEIYDIINASPKQEPFTQIPNRLLCDPTLSLKSKGLLCIELMLKQQGDVGEEQT